MLPQPEWSTSSEQTCNLFCSGNFYKAALFRQCGCRVCLVMGELHIRVQLTEQRSEGRRRVDTLAEGFDWAYDQFGAWPTLS